ncbi:MAG: hypothetical protein CSA66_07735 [Proteobacteria bacterium]|nr:MAG: hypothetical protein CSA66_07735 [Pseudomonadota bacterium]
MKPPTPTSDAAQAPPGAADLDGIALTHALLELVPELGVVFVDQALTCRAAGGGPLSRAGDVGDLIEALRPQLVAAAMDEQVQQTRLTVADGGTLDVRVSPSRRPRGAIVILRDRPELLAERRVQEVNRRERLYQIVARHLPDSAVLLFDTELRYLLAEGPALEATGYPTTELVGRTLPQVLEPDAAERIAPIYRAVLEGRSVDVTQDLSDGRTFSLKAVPVREGGEVVAGIVVARDVSRERRLEAQLRQSQKMEAIGTLASGVAHDYNNLLMGISGCAEISLRYVGQDSRARPFLEQVLRAAKRGASLTRQLLLFSRRKEAQPTLVDVGAVVMESEKMLRSLLGESIALKVALDNADWKVRCDPGHLQQVLMNLVVWVTLLVRDDGVGMDGETLERVFEPFFTTKEVGRGTGLGLSTVYGIVKQAGGHIDIESSVGQGATFTVYLPRALGEDEGRGERTHAPAKPGGETVLVVDDEPLVRLTLRAFLEPLGYSVLEACDRAEATLVARAHEGAIDLLVSDVMLPGALGRDVEADLRPRFPRLLTVFMSAHPADALRDAGYVREDAVVLEKPFSEGRLMEEIDRILGR